MKLWIDADACPVKIKEILYKVAMKRQITVTFVANQYLNLPKSPFLKMLRVDKGFDLADQMIVDQVSANDVVVTSDIPLASDVVDKGAIALSPRGEAFTPDNVKQKLCFRNTSESMRESGIQTTNAPPLHARDVQQFANALDRILAKM